MFGPLGAAEVAPVVIPGVAPLSHAEVPETEGEKVTLTEMLHCVVLILDLEMLRAMWDREDESAIVVEVLRVWFRGAPWYLCIASEDSAIVCTFDYKEEPCDAIYFAMKSLLCVAVSASTIDEVEFDVSAPEEPTIHSG